MIPVEASSPAPPYSQLAHSYLWNSIKFGETQEDTREIIWAFNCSLHHVAGVHSWPPNPNLTGPYTECSHPPLLGARDFDLIEGDAAFQRVKDCILNKALQRDLPKASMRGTSFCETKNALDRIYCPKEVYFPHSTYHAYSMMSALHLNEQTMSEEDGKRAVTHEYDVKRKYQDRLSKKKVKTEVRQAWRDDVHKEVLRQMAKKRQLAVEAIRARKENRAGNTSSESETEVELDSDDKDVSEWIHATVAEEKERLASRAAVVGMQLDPDSDEDYQERPVQDYAYDIFNGFTDLDYDDYLSKRYNNA